MKIRSGMVSNSSSSSFIIATRSEMDDEKVAQIVMTTFLVPPESPMYWLAVDAANILVRKARPMTLAEFCEDRDCETVNEFLAKPGLTSSFVGRALRKGFTCFYKGEVGDQDEMPEYVLCETAISYDGDDVMIEKEAGY